MPDTPTTPPNPVAPSPAITTPPSPSDLPNSFLTSLRKAIKSETEGVVPKGPEKPEVKPVDFSSRSSGTLGQIVNDLAREAKRKAENPTPPTTETTPPVVTPPIVTPPVAVTPPLVTPPVVTPPAPVAPPPEVEKFKLPVIPQGPSNLPTTQAIPSNLDLTGLDEDERSEMETAVFAEQRHPERYKGHAARVLEFIKQHKRVVQEIEASGETDVEESSRYKSFVKANRPTVTAAERRRLDQERIAYEASQQAKAEVQQELNELRKQVSQTRAEPVIERSVNEFRQVIESILPKSDDPLEQQITTNINQGAVSAANEFIRLSNRQKQYDESNPVHKWTADFIEEQARVFLRSGDPNLKRGSQSFVSRAAYNTMAPETRSKHFTFTDEDVLRIIAVNARMAAEEGIKRQRQQLEAAGYTRKAPTTVSTPPLTPAQMVLDPSPRSSSAPSNVEPIVSKKDKDPFKFFLMDKTETK